ncbi:MAG: hypothetical protein ACYC33_05575 [Thermoleophilia bacterium]
MLRPVFLAALVGYPLAVMFPLTNAQGYVHIADALGFNVMFAAYALGEILMFHRFRWWHAAALGSASVASVYLAERAKLLSMLFAFAFTSLRAKHISRQSMSAIVAVGIVTGFIIVGVGSAPQAGAKAMDGNGWNLTGLIATSSARYAERVAITQEMNGIEYVVGKGAGAVWDGSDFYDAPSGIVRQGFHIYYFEMIFQYGFIGLLLLMSVIIKPTIVAIAHSDELNAVGLMGLASLVALLLSWFGSAAYTMNEGSFVAIGIYALYCGRRQYDTRAGIGTAP